MDEMDKMSVAPNYSVPISSSSSSSYPHTSPRVYNTGSPNDNFEVRRKKEPSVVKWGTLNTEVEQVHSWGGEAATWDELNDGGLLMNDKGERKVGSTSVMSTSTSTTRYTKPVRNPERDAELEEIEAMLDPSYTSKYNKSFESVDQYIPLAQQVKIKANNNPKIGALQRGSTATRSAEELSAYHNALKKKEAALKAAEEELKRMELEKKLRQKEQILAAKEAEIAKQRRALESDLNRADGGFVVVNKTAKRDQVQKMRTQTDIRGPNDKSYP